MYGLFFWNDLSDLLKHRSSTILEELYTEWVSNYVCNEVVVHYEEFRRLFPNNLLSSSKFEDIVSWRRSSLGKII